MNKVNCKDSALAFLFGFIFCQVCLAIALLFGTAICSSLGMNANKVTDFFNANCFGYLICSIAMYLGIFLTSWYFKRKKEVKVISKPTLKKVLFYAGITIIVFFALNPIMQVSYKIIPAKEFPYKLTTQGYLISIISLAILPAIFEEILFRGIIFNGLKHVGKTFSIVTTAIMFAIFHMSFSQTLYPILLGLLFSVIMYKENNILYTIIAHFISNFLTLTIAYFKIPLAFKHWTYILIAIVLFVSYLTIILYISIKGNKKTQNKMTREEKTYFCSCNAIMIILWIILSISSILWKTNQLE